MKKLLKKKRRIGKFRELGIKCEFLHTGHISAVMDDFDAYIESKNWEAYGGGGEDMSQIIIRCSGGKLHAPMTKEDKNQLTNWLVAQPWFSKITNCHLIDINHDDLES